jgi:hypothetical protein
MVARWIGRSAHDAKQVAASPHAINIERRSARSTSGSAQEEVIDLMDSVRINFANADFALQGDGEFVFPALNPNGQCLFIEEGCPESRHAVPPALSLQVGKGTRALPRAGYNGRLL